MLLYFNPSHGYSSGLEYIWFLLNIEEYNAKRINIINLIFVAQSAMVYKYKAD